MQLPHYPERMNRLKGYFYKEVYKRRFSLKYFHTQLKENKSDIRVGITSLFIAPLSDGSNESRACHWLGESHQLVGSSSLSKRDITENVTIDLEI